MTKIEILNQNREIALQPYREIQDDRMKRYFDCQDDSIMGGISWQVTSEKMNKINRKYDLLVEQEMNGGFLCRNEESIQLYRDGVMVSDKLCKGKFGLFFVLTDGSFVSVAKKKATFDKKGFEVKVVTQGYKVNFTKITDNGSVIYHNITPTGTIVRSFDFQNDIFSQSNNWIAYLLNQSK